MSDETNAIEELRQCFVGLFGYSESWPEHGNVPLAISSKAALLKDEVANLERQLTAERERVTVLTKALADITTFSLPHDHQYSGDWEVYQQLAVGLKSIARDALARQPHAPAKPCPDCGATDRAHTCPNWRGGELERQRAIQILYSATHASHWDQDSCTRFVDSIMDAIDARLARGK